MIARSFHHFKAARVQRHRNLVVVHCLDAFDKEEAKGAEFGSDPNSLLPTEIRPSGGKAFFNLIFRNVGFGDTVYPVMTVLGGKIAVLREEFGRELGMTSVGPQVNYVFTEGAGD